MRCVGVVSVPVRRAFVSGWRQVEPSVLMSVSVLGSVKSGAGLAVGKALAVNYELVSISSLPQIIIDKFKNI